MTTFVGSPESRIPNPESRIPNPESRIPNPESRIPVLLEIQERPQLLAARGMPQLAQGLGFDLADALAGDVELLADLFQRVVGVHVNAEAHAQHLGFARREACEHFAHRFHKTRFGSRLDRRTD